MEELPEAKAVAISFDSTAVLIDPVDSIEAKIPVQISSEKIKRRKTSITHKNRPKTNKNGTISRSSSIANFRRGVTPLQLVKKQEEEKRKKREAALSLEKPIEPYGDPNSPIKDTVEEKKKPTPSTTVMSPKKKKKILRQYRTALSCNASLISVQAEKAQKAREESIVQGKKISGCMMQYGQLIKLADDNSLLFHSLTQSAEFIDIMGELQASWSRNLFRRVIQPVKSLGNVADNKNTEITSSHLLDCSNSLIGFAGVYLNFFKVGHKNMSMLYEQIMEYRTVVAFDRQQNISFEVGKRCTIPHQMISMSGNGMKKGAIRHNWKQRWFILYYNHLLYFSSQAESILRGHISLDNAIVTTTTPHRKYSFVLNIYANARNYLIAYTSEAEMNTWMDLIKASITKHPATYVRSQICLVEPKMVVAGSSDKNYKPPTSLDYFLSQDMFSRYWRDFRAKDSNFMCWITQEPRLLELISCSLTFVPDVTREELDILEESIAKTASETSKKQTGKLQRTLSSFGIKKETATLPQMEMELKRSDNAMLFKTANSAFNVLVSSEYMANAFVHSEAAMIMLFTFMQEEMPPVQPRRFHAFTELIISLLRHKSQEVFAFLSGREDIMAGLLRHIENEHCLRLLLGLWSYSQSEEKVNVLNQLGIMVLRRYFVKDVGEQEYENCTIFLRELIRRHRLLTMRPETVMILTKMKENYNATYSSGMKMGVIDLEEGLEIYSPRATVTNSKALNKLNKSETKNKEANETKEGSTTSPSSPTISTPADAILAVEKVEEKKKEAAEDVFTHVRPRRQSEVRRDWVDLSWSEFDEEKENEENEDEGTEEGEKTEQEEEEANNGGAPNKPLPNVPPAKPKPSKQNRERLNCLAPGYMESKTAPFMTALKNRNIIGVLISNALQFDNQTKSERSTELLISMLKINRSKESYQNDMGVPGTGNDIIQKAPHMVITELVSKFPFIAEILKLPKEKKKSSRTFPPPLGMFKYNLVRLIRYVIDCGFRFVDRNLIESKLLYRCVALTFAYPRHSILLSIMNEMFTIIYTRTIHEELGVKLIKKYKFTQKLMNAVKSNDDEVQPPTITSYMVDLANTMSANAMAQKLLRKNSEWINFLADAVLPSLMLQYSDRIDIPQRDPEKQKLEAEKWLRRWEEFNFLYSV